MNKLRILWITPGNPLMKTPETTIAEQLAIRGHDVTLAFGFNSNLLKKEYDIVVGAMEYSMNTANFIGRKLNIPVYNHMEWIPPWRVGMEDPKLWGYDETQAEQLTPQHIAQYTDMYIQQIQDWENATVRSCAGQALIGTMRRFMSMPIVFGTRYPTKRFEEMDQYANDRIEEKNQIMCTARLVPHKKIIHVVRALALVDGNRPALKIVGYGSEKESIELEAKKLGVDIEFMGPGIGGDKERLIQESMFSVNIWAGLPIAESFYFGKPAITYDDAAVVEQFDDTPVYAERNNIEDLAKKIKMLCDNPELREDLGQSAQQRLLNNKLNIKMPDATCENIEIILEKGIEIWKTGKETWKKDE